VIPLEWLQKGLGALSSVEGAEDWGSRLPTLSPWGRLPWRETTCVADSFMATKNLTPTPFDYAGISIIDALSIVQPPPFRPGKRRPFNSASPLGGLCGLFVALFVVVFHWCVPFPS